MYNFDMKHVLKFFYKIIYDMKEGSKSWVPQGSIRGGIKVLLIN